MENRRGAQLGKKREGIEESGRKSFDPYFENEKKASVHVSLKFSFKMQF